MQQLVVKTPLSSDAEGNELKSEVQQQAAQYQAQHGKVVHNCYVGFGKTRIGEQVLRDVEQSLLPFDVILVVCPKHLKDKWELILSKYAPDQKDSRVMTPTEYTVTNKDKKWKCALLIVDECHRILNKESQYFSTVLKNTEAEHVCLLSGTLLKEHEKFLLEHGIHHSFKVSKLWGFKNKLIPQYTVLNVPIKLTLKEASDYAENQKMLERHEKYLANGEIFDPYAKFMLDNGIDDEAVINPALVDAAAELGVTPEQVFGVIQKWQATIRVRSQILYNAKNKIAVMKKALEYMPEKVLIYCGSKLFAESLVEQTTTCSTLHSGTGVRKAREAINAFENDIRPHMVLIGKWKDGIDYPDCRFAMRAAYNTKTTDTEQIGGRVIRLSEEYPDKEAYLINYYVDDFEAGGKVVLSQEKKWLRDNLANERNVEYLPSALEFIEVIKRIVSGEGLIINRPEDDRGI